MSRAYLDIQLEVEAEPGSEALAPFGEWACLNDRNQLGSSSPPLTSLVTSPGSQLAGIHTLRVTSIDIPFFAVAYTYR